MSGTCKEINPTHPAGDYWLITSHLGRYVVLSAQRPQQKLGIRAEMGQKEHSTSYRTQDKGLIFGVLLQPRDRIGFRRGSCGVSE